MNAEETIECPYCGSSIRKHVEVCLYCRREVQKIITLQVELEKYRLTSVPVAAAVAAKPAAESRSTEAGKKIHLGFFAAGFVIITSILLTFYFDSDTWFKIFPLYEIIFFISFPVFIYIGVTYVRDFNFWIIALLAVFLPYIIFYLAPRFEILPKAKVIMSLSNAPYIFGAYVLISGLVSTVIIDKIKLKRVFSFSGLTGYLTQTQTLTDKIEKMILIITTILASLKTIQEIFKP